MELFLLYVWLRLNIILIWGCIGVLVTGGMFLFIVANNDEPEPRYNTTEVDPKKMAFYQYWRRIMFNCRNWCIGLFLVLLLCPDKEDTAYLVAGHFAIEAAHSPEAAKLVSLLRGKVNEYLNEQIAKLPAAAASAASAATK
jgi:hypothetical protein